MILTQGNKQIKDPELQKGTVFYHANSKISNLLENVIYKNLTLTDRVYCSKYMFVWALLFDFLKKEA